MIDQAGLDAWHLKMVTRYKRRNAARAARRARREAAKAAAIRAWEKNFFREIGLVNDTKNPFAEKRGKNPFGQAAAMVVPHRTVNPTPSAEHWGFESLPAHQTRAHDAEA